VAGGANPHRRLLLPRLRPRLAGLLLPADTTGHRPRGHIPLTRLLRDQDIPTTTRRAFLQGDDWAEGEVDGSTVLFLVVLYHRYRTGRRWLGESDKMGNFSTAM
jgi:hypothetical protein